MMEVGRTQREQGTGQRGVSLQNARDRGVHFGPVGPRLLSKGQRDGCQGGCGGSNLLEEIYVRAWAPKVLVPPRRRRQRGKREEASGPVPPCGPGGGRAARCRGPPHATARALWGRADVWRVVCVTRPPRSGRPAPRFVCRDVEREPSQAFLSAFAFCEIAQIVLNRPLRFAAIRNICSISRSIIDPP